MASKTITIRRELLKLYRNATPKGVLVALIEKADKCGAVVLSVIRFASEIGVESPAVERVLKDLVERKVISIQPLGRTRRSKILVTFLNKNKQVADLEAALAKERKVKVIEADTILPPFVNPQFAKAWEMWIQYKRETRKNFKTTKSAEIGYKRLYNLSQGNPYIAEQIIEQTIANGYQGIFPLNNNSNGRCSQVLNSEQPSGRSQFSDSTLADLASEISSRYSD